MLRAYLTAKAVFRSEANGARFNSKSPFATLISTYFSGSNHYSVAAFANAGLSD